MTESLLLKGGAGSIATVLRSRNIQQIYGVFWYFSLPKDYKFNQMGKSEKILTVKNLIFWTSKHIFFRSNWILPHNPDVSKKQMIKFKRRKYSKAEEFFSARYFYLEEITQKKRIEKEEYKCIIE